MFAHLKANYPGTPFVLDTLRARGCRTLAYIGGNDGRFRSGPGVTVSPEPLRMRTVLEACTLGIAHSALSTGCALLQAGIPGGFLPMHQEQLASARVAAERLKAAIAVPPVALEKQLGRVAREHAIALTPRRDPIERAAEAILGGERTLAEQIARSEQNDLALDGCIAALDPVDARWRHGWGMSRGWARERRGTMTERTTATWTPGVDRDRDPHSRLAFCLLAFPTEPNRVGEVAFLDALDGPAVIGRNGTLRWEHHRPDGSAETGPLADPQISREQLHVSVDRSGVHIENVGRLPLRLNGQPAQSCRLQDGDLVELGDRVMLRLTLRAPLPEGASAKFGFGLPDASGWVGESDVAWALREQVRFVAQRAVHVLVTGPSGSGKELVARALHAQSRRARRPLVSRNAATIPESLADAELFGNVRSYPNPGMPARPGLIGEADGSTLFLDEFGELPEPIQARLLRVADDGEYTPLGEARARRSDVRLIAATNRDLAALKHDLRARFKIVLPVPPLQERLDDLPLLAAHLVRRIATDDEGLRRRLFDDGELERGPRITFRLLRRLMTHRYTTHVRELESLLWSAISASQDGRLDQLGPVVSLLPSQPTGHVDPGSLDPGVVQAVLDRHGGRQEPAWKELGMSSRHVLARFVKKHGLRVRKRG